MSSEVMIAKWVEALESGRYLQGIGQLRSGNAYCCLGVLCDLVDPSAWQGCCHYSRKEMPPPYVMAQVGLTDSFMDDLIHLNDGGSSFKEIAGVIRGKLG